MLSSLVRIINVSIAVVVVLAAVAIYWFAYRPLPKTSGEISAPLGHSALILRDARGVPHIEAASWQDAIFLQGYATAQDRLWQMDSLRRFGAGELAEVFGPAVIAADERSRRMRMRAIAEADSSRLRPEDRAAIVEYARGVNFFINTHRGDYSLEFSLPGHAYDPKPWTAADSILVGLVMFRDMTDTMKEETNRGDLARIADPAKFGILFPPSLGSYVSPGSNAWAVSGAHTADGKAMTANDTHLAYGIPGTWHQVHLKAPGLNVEGTALPGLPGVITGHNEQIAWGLTNVAFDVMDLYIEQIDERTGRYLYNGKIEQAQLDREVIGVRGAKPVQVDIWITRHGPIVSNDGGRLLSMRWTAAEGFGFPTLEVNRAGNWQQFRSALSTFWGPGQNFVYADKNGNIGYQATGAFPIRPNFDGNIPLNGSSGNFEWNGYIPFENLPSIYDPASGIVATANQSAFPPDFPYRVNGNFADAWRVDQIRCLLSSKGGLTVSDMLAIEKDVYSAYDQFLARESVAAIGKKESRDNLVNESANILKSWNGQMDKDEAAPAITELLNEQLAKALVQSIAKTSTPPDLEPRPQIIAMLLQRRPRGWVAKDDWDGWLVENLRIALSTGRARLGGRLANWKWGSLHEWNFTHPVGKNLPLVSSLFNIGPVPMSGSGTTVKQTTASIGPSERIVVDLGDFEKSVWNIVTGESGYVASRHYKDQWPSYYVGKSFPMEFNRVNAKQTLRIRPQ